MKLFQMHDSGNCYKIRLAASQLNINLELIDTNILQGESRTEKFLQKNPNGRVPTLFIDGAGAGAGEDQGDADRGLRAH